MIKRPEKDLILPVPPVPPGDAPELAVDESPWTGERYEYRSEMLSIDGGIVRALNRLGEYGWHLAAPPIGHPGRQLEVLLVRRLSPVVAPTQEQS